MKRDMDLIREMLLLIENHPDVPPYSLQVDDFLNLNSNPEIISFHIDLMREAGLIEVGGASYGEVKDYYVSRLTFAGYDYLDSVRNAKIWRNVKEKIKVVGGATFDIIKAVAIAEIKQELHI